VKITFSTPQGAVEDDFQTDQPLGSLKADVLGRLRLPAEWVDQYVVALDDNTLDEAKTPAELGLNEGSTLVVWRVASTRANRSSG
jgi:hypothetical protein